MAYTVINTREDLDAITGTPEHDAFMATLRGTLWRLEKDDDAGVWRAVEDNTTITRFGFSRADFPGAVAPELPAYVPQDHKDSDYANAPIVSELVRLEQSQIRPIAECLAALIAGDPLPSYAKEKFSEIESQKAEKRKGLVK